MKKIVILFAITLSPALFAYNQMLEIIELNSEISSAVELRSNADRFIESQISIYAQNPNFWESRQSRPNTFVWYLWRDFDRAKGFEKLKIAKTLTHISISN